MHMIDSKISGIKDDGDAGVYDMDGINVHRGGNGEKK